MDSSVRASVPGAVDRSSIDRARAELRHLGEALTQFELLHPDSSDVPTDLLRTMAASARRLVLTIGEFIVTADVGHASLVAEIPPST